MRGLGFSAELCALARRNLEIVARRRGLPGPTEVLHCDATEYDLQPDERVVSLFNPFDERVRAGFVDHLVRSLASHPRPIWLIDGHPDHAPPSKLAPPSSAPPTAMSAGGRSRCTRGGEGRASPRSGR